jgi:uncharacterized surface protein with fasciclin (FAS1) repeats
MKTIKELRQSSMLFVMGAMLASTIVSCKKDDTPVTPPATANIVELAQTDTTLSILVSAVTKAGLASTLSTTPDLTVFAPTNAAFRAAGYPQTAIDALTPTQVTDILAPILKYHVVGAKVMAAGVPASDTVKSLNGKNIFASKNTNGVFVNGIKVSKADLSASNGVVHVIDGVLIPPTQTITQIVVGNPNFSLLKAAVIRAGLDGVLGGAGKFTVFAPVNAAFPASLDTDAKITGSPVDAVAAIIKAHAIGTNVFASDLITNTTAPTLNANQTLTITIPPAAVKITNGTNTVSSAVTTANIVATNGVIHIIDKVLQ